MEKLIRTLATFSIFLASIRTRHGAFWCGRSVALAAPLAHMVMLPFSYLSFMKPMKMEVLGAWLLLVGCDQTAPWLGPGRYAGFHPEPGAA